MNTPDTEKCCEKCTDGSISGIWCNDESCSCHTPDTEWQEIANQIGLATYGGVSFQANPEYVEKIRNIISSRDTYWKERVRKGVEGMRKDFVPADLFWEGDEEQEVGEWKYAPKEDGMYCLNCERFVPEEGCMCGLISFEALDTLLDNLK